MASSEDVAMKNLTIFALMASCLSATTITFPSGEALRKALLPLSLEEVQSCSGADLEFRIDPSIEEVVPLRVPIDLLHTPLYRFPYWTVYYPETPRIPHHLIIAFNRGVSGIGDITSEENAELFAIIRKVAEIYKAISIRGFVIAQFDKPQPGHSQRYVVELLPHLPGFSEVKNIVDKVDCHRYVLFRREDLSSVPYPIHQNEIDGHVCFWQRAFQTETAPLEERDTKIYFPYQRKESHQIEAEKVLQQHLVEFLRNRGGKISQLDPFIMPTEVPADPKIVAVDHCLFCDDRVIRQQLVYTYKNISVFYNFRKGAKPGSNFLILPQKHTEKIYDLTTEEIENIWIVRKALVSVLKETHPECEVIIYTQDDPAIGQTVFHSHEQVVAVDPSTIALTWTFMTLYPRGNVSEEEMQVIKEKFHLKLEDKLKTMNAI